MEQSLPLAALLEELALSLRQSGLFDGVAVSTRFPSSPKEFPLRRPHLSVGIDKLTLPPSGLEESTGKEETASFGRQTEVTLSFGIYAPAAQEGDGCLSLLSLLLTHLTTVWRGGLGEVSCSAVEYRREISGYALSCTVGWTVWWGGEHTPPLYADFSVRREET